MHWHENVGLEHFQRELVSGRRLIRGLLTQGQVNIIIRHAAMVRWPERCAVRQTTWMLKYEAA